VSGQGYLLGIDLGTSNTVAVLRRPDGQSRPLLLDGGPVMPSGVLLDHEGRIHVGRDASRMALLDPAAFEPHPKRRITEQFIRLGGREVAVVDLLAGILAAVARAAVEAVGFLPPVVMTHPAAWDEGRRQRLQEAAARAGYPPVALVPEPVAAARYFTDVLRRPVAVGASVAVFDFGGGTLDIAVLRREPTGFVLVGTGGDQELGGLDVDTALGHHLANQDRGRNPQVWQAIARPQDDSQRRAQRMFWDDVRGAKEMLSRAASAPVGVPGLGAPVTITRDDLDHAAMPLVTNAVRETARVLHAAGVRPSDLAGLFLVGGASRLPSVARELHGALYVAPAVIEQPEIPVAEGALAHVAPVPAGPAAAPMPAPPAATRVPLLRRRLTWVVAFVAVLLLASAGTAAALVMRGRNTASPTAGASASASPTGPVTPKFISLRRVGDPIPIDKGAKTTDLWTDALADDVILAWPVGKDLKVTSVELASGSRHWTTSLKTDRQEWAALRAVGSKLLVLTDNTDGTKSRLMVLDLASGTVAWQTDMPDGGRLIPAHDVIVVTGRNDDDARGLDLATGRQLWQRTADSPTNQLVQLTPEAELTGPASYTTLPWEFDLAARNQLVEITPQSAINIIDVKTGKVVTTLSGVVTGLERKFFGTADRFYAATSTNGGLYELRMWDLTKPSAQPVLLYSSPANRTPTRLMSCLGSAICVMDTPVTASSDTQVVAVDPVGHRTLWRQAAPDTNDMVPAGNSLLAYDARTRPHSLLFDRTGKQLLGPDQQKEYAVRASSGGLIAFHQSIDNRKTTDDTLTGIDATTGQATDLGALSDTVNGTCSWNTTFVACPAAAALGGTFEFRIWRFADG
jgi:hypothetical protein